MTTQGSCGVIPVSTSLQVLIILKQVVVVVVYASALSWYY